MSAIKLGSTTVDFEIDGKIHSLKKITRLAYEQYLEAMREFKDDKNSVDAQKAEIKASEDLIISAGLPEEVAKSLPLEAYAIIVENLVAKKK